MLSPKDVLDRDAETQALAVQRGERRLDEQCALATAQDARIILTLSTAVSLAALAAVVAAAALSFPGHPTAVLTAAMAALLGFSIAAIFALVAIRSRRFETSGSAPAAVLDASSASGECQARWLCELDRRVAVNEVMLEQRRRWLTWAAWTFMLTPLYALVVGWLAAQ